MGYYIQHSTSRITGNLDTALTLRDTVGFPKDKIYLLGDWDGHDSYIGNATDPADLAEIAATVK